MRTCPYCGSAVSDTAKFCQNCGADLRIPVEDRNTRVYTPVNIRTDGQTDAREKEESYRQEDSRGYEDLYRQETAREYEEPYRQETARNYEEPYGQNEIPKNKKRSGQSDAGKKSVRNYDRLGRDEEESLYSRENKKTVAVGVILAVLICVVGVGVWFVVSNMLNQEAEIDVGSGLNNKTVQVTAAPEEEDTSDDTEDTENTEEAAEESTEETAAVTASVTTADPDLQGIYSEAGVSASSSSSILEDSGVYHTADLMLDGLETTSWQEASDGDGTGEWVQLQLDRQYSVRYITFKLGNWRNEQLFYANNRPARILLTLDGQEFYLDFPDGMNSYTVELSADCTASTVTVQILGVYDGASWDDCCISEMAVYGS